MYLGRDTQQSLNPNEEVRTVARIVNHPNYNDTPENNDVCLLQLSAAVTFTDYIRPVCLAAAASSFPAGTGTWVTGWGTIGSGGETLYWGWETSTGGEGLLVELHSKSSTGRVLLVEF